MARDGLLPAWAARISPRFHTPYVSSLLIAVVVMALAGTLPISMVAQLVSIGTLMAFAIVCIGVLVLRACAIRRCRGVQGAGDLAGGACDAHRALFCSCWGFREQRGFVW